LGVTLVPVDSQYIASLPQAMSLSLQFAGSQNNDVLRPRIEWVTPRAGAICGTATPFCLRAATASAV